MKRFFITFVLLNLLVSTSILAQDYQLEKNKSRVLVNGTSNLHDWEIVVEEYQSSLLLERETQQMEKLNQLQFTAVATSLSSGKGGMDKNTYKALQTDRFELIRFKQTTSEVLTSSTTGHYESRVKGTLEIAGQQKNITLHLNLEQDDEGLRLRGTHKINMETYDIEPPKALFGTIKTGADVEVDFDLFYLEIQ